MENEKESLKQILDAVAQTTENGLQVLALVAGVIRQVETNGKGEK